MGYGIRIALKALRGAIVPLCLPFAAAALVFTSSASQADTGVKETVLWTFSGSPDGDSPYAAVIADERGALYGTTGYGGSLGNGTVFKLTPPIVFQTGWKEDVLYSFSGGSDGCNPYAELFARTESPLPSARLYGTTSFCGASGNGTVFRVTDHTLTTLWTFTGGSDGASPAAALVADEETGALYGTTYAGGGASGSGTVFKIDPADQTLNTIWTFSGDDGANPMGRLLADDSGALYGTTAGGGKSGAGVVFKLTPPARGQTGWTRTVLYSFCTQPNCSDGAGPFFAGLIADESGALYGTTAGGGSNNCFGGCGTVFRLTPPGDHKTAWKLTTLWTFTGGSDGALPSAPLIADEKGALYGTTERGGVPTPVCFFGACGVVFKLTPPARGQTVWTETVLWSFSGGSDGGNADAGLSADETGALYGTTQFGGNVSNPQGPCSNYGCGVVFKLTGTGFAR